MRNGPTVQRLWISSQIFTRGFDCVATMLGRIGAGISTAALRRAASSSAATARFRFQPKAMVMPCVTSRPFSAASSGVVPIIDLKGFRFSDAKSKKAVAAEIGRACEEIGFFGIVNHGLEHDTVHNMWNTTRAYFDRPVPEKKLIPMTEQYPYGYRSFSAMA